VVLKGKKRLMKKTRKINSEAPRQLRTRDSWRLLAKEILEKRGKKKKGLARFEIKLGV